MNCNNCGAPLNEGAAFCSVCGNPVAQSQPQNPQNGYDQYGRYGYDQYDQYGFNNQSINYYSQESEEVKSSANKALVFGILSVIMPDTCLAFLGIIFASIANKHVRTYESYMGEVTGKVKAARILAKIGMIAGIVMTVIWGLTALLYLIYFIAYGAFIFSFV